MAKDKLICNCNRTMPLDGNAVGRALKSGATPHVYTELCRRHISAFEAAVKNGNDLVVACTQEAPLFSELHGQLKGSGSIQFVNIREAAGWSAEATQAAPKIAALLALADLPEPEPVPVVSYRSEGELLIAGPGARVLPWAEQLADQFGISVLLSDVVATELPATRRYPVWSGHVGAIKGYLGAFEVEWEQANPIDLETCTRCNACIHACPEQAIDFSYQIDLDKCKAHRECVKACGEIKAIDFERRETRRSERFDLVLDLNDRPLLDMPQPPQGYFAPGGDALALARAVRELAQMSGEFEKPKFFEYKEKICAHGRSGIVGCTKCIDVCSTRAIASELEENRVKVEPHLCMGCGGCATVCPSGAMTYAYPRVADLGARIKTVLRVYREAGGEGACLLFHNTTDGRELIARLARRGRGLPAHVIPLEVFHVASLGLDLMLGSIALGAAQFAIVSAGSEPSAYHGALERQASLAQEIADGLGLGTGRFHVIKARDAAALENAIWALERPRALTPATFNLANDKRATLGFTFDHLLRHAPVRKEEIPLAADAPYGAVEVDKQKCTMCLACVGACPENALMDAKDKPQLRFVERNCVQCGLCEKTCPEDAITLRPRLLLTANATQPVVLNEDKVFDCVRCGKPFANQRIIENMLGKLTTHSMFRDPAALRRLQMCQDCRVVDMFEKGNDGTIFDGDRGRSNVDEAGSDHAAAAVLEPEDRARANLYALISRLYYGPADPNLLSEITGAKGDAEGQGNEGELAMAWRALQDACRNAYPAVVRQEYDGLFIGVGRAAVTLYLSGYAEPSAPDRFLVRLRGQLSVWGLARRAGVNEVEDHVSGISDVMRWLVVNGHPLMEQRQFFENFAYPGAIRFCSAVQNAVSASFYKPVATFTAAFLEIERAAFEMSASE